MIHRFGKGDVPVHIVDGLLKEMEGLYEHKDNRENHTADDIRYGELTHPFDKVMEETADNGEEETDAEMQTNHLACEMDQIYPYINREESDFAIGDDE